jgi:hypothetical protein
MCHCRSTSGEAIQVMIEMKTHIYGLALAALLAVAPALAGHAEEATPAAENPPAAATGQTQSPPVSVARPSIVPKSAEKSTEQQPPSSDAAAEAAPPRQRHARRHYRRYATYWTPFPIYLPHFTHSRIVWSRMPGFSF